MKGSEAVELRVKHSNPNLRKGEVKNVRRAPAVADSKGACLSESDCPAVIAKLSRVTDSRLSSAAKRLIIISRPKSCAVAQGRKWSGAS